MLNFLSWKNKFFLKSDELWLLIDYIFNICILQNTRIYFWFFIQKVILHEVKFFIFIHKERMQGNFPQRNESVRVITSTNKKFMFCRGTWFFFLNHMTQIFSKYLFWHRNYELLLLSKSRKYDLVNKYLKITEIL